MYRKLICKIREFKKIIIHRHSRPDGDALGSQLGLKDIIKTTFPKKEVYCVGDISERLSFIGEMDKIEDSMYQDALVIILDTGEKSMISDDRYSLGKYKIKIDHHIFKESYADLEIVDQSFESAAGLIADIAFSNHLKMTNKGAKALFTGIVTDSSRFRYDSVTSRTLEIASRLMKYDINTNDIYNNLYVDEMQMVRLRAMCTLKFKVTDSGVAYMKNTQEDIENYNVDVFTISRGMVNVMGGIRGIDIWVNFTEDAQNKSVIAEIRSTTKYNINPIAVKYGGGGHKCASGATLKDFSEADKMLEELENLVKENN